ncbi:MAG TPA: thiamine phosphate synthase [Vicinamibacteria bacterium]|nr:thiamine phosphate synthase [Vicinamibacteria bacterium]
MLPPRPFLYPILDLGLLGTRRPGAVASTLLDGGVTLLQLRGKTASDRELVVAAREVLAVTRPRGAYLVINDRPDVAMVVGADGVHVGQDDLRPRDVRALVGSRLIVGVSTHDLAQVTAAAGEPVDYVALGPVFETRTKARPDPVVGLDLLAQARLLARRPLVAIGGIDVANARAVVQAGADGLAVVSALLGARDLARALGDLDLELRR